MHNLYYPVYKNLENEVTDLAYKIHFTDEEKASQLNVYSIKIAELLVRCCVEIEAISKDLYLSNGGNPEPLNDDGTKRELYFDTDCLAYLESKWLLSKKNVYTSSPNFYFTKDKNKVLTPLKKANERGGAKWNKAYQAVKHNRSRDLSQATVENLLHAMAALYLLNIYYKDAEPQYMGGWKAQKKFDNTIGSSLFSVKLQLQSRPIFPAVIISDVDEDAVYIEKYAGRDYNKWVEGKETRLKDFVKNPKIQDILKKNNRYLTEQMSIYDICQETGDKDLLAEFQKIVFFITDNPSYEIVLNKNQEI